MTGIDEKAIEIATRYGGFDAGTTGHRWLAEAIAEALSALPVAPMPGVKVKPLKEKTQGWKDDKGRFCLPFSEGYFIKFPPEKGGLYMVWFFTNPIAGYAQLKDAIAAANAHHEGRILSALDVPAHPEGVKASAEHGPETEAVLRRDGFFLTIEWWRLGTKLTARVYEPQGLPISAALADLLALALEERPKLAASALSHPEPVAQEAVALTEPVARQPAETLYEAMRREIEALRAALTGKQVAPLAYASAGQIMSFEDRADDEGGVYVPLRRTPVGMFQLPLFASQPVLAHPSPSPEQGEETGGAV